MGALRMIGRALCSSPCMRAGTSAGIAGLARCVIDPALHVGTLVPCGALSAIRGEDRHGSLTVKPASAGNLENDGCLRLEHFKGTNSAFVRSAHSAHYEA